jgi:RNA polymerase sigma factor for flagellar operon FliA
MARSAAATSARPSLSRSAKSTGQPDQTARSLTKSVKNGKIALAAPAAHRRRAAPAPAPTPHLRKLPAAPAAAPAAPAKAATNTDDLEPIWIAYKSTKDQNLRNILIERHVALVRTIAERLLQTLPKSIELDDLTSAGTFGLMDAIDGFDLARGIKFKTYCTTRIRGSILDELRSQDWVPRLVRLKAHRLDRALRELEGRLGRDPNEFELAEAMGMTLSELHATEAEANAKTIFSLSEKWDDGDDDKEMEKVEILADKKGPDPVQTIHQKDLLDVITRNLTKKERLIIIMYYYEGLTMREIGEIMQLTESRVCQIHSNVMARLKAQLDQVQLQAV